MNGITINYLDFDIYSKSIGFFYHDKERIGSLFGFVLTIIYIIATLCLFIFYTIETINKSDIKVHDSILYQKEVPEMIINYNNFYFAFGVENYLTGFTRFIDETIYYPKILYINKIKEGSTFKTIEEIPLDYERCDESKFGKEYQNLLVNGELNNSYCLKNFNLTLSGNFKYNRLSYIKINIYPCINTTENNNHCKPKKIINTFLSGTFISILVKDIGLDPSNYLNPIVPQFQDIYVTIDKSYFRDFVIFFGITEIQTDEGLFFENFQKERYINYMKTTQGIYYQDEKNYNNGDSMCEVQFRMSDDIRIQKRTYRKMSEAFAITGGYMQLISTIFSILTFLTNKIEYEVQMVNSLFNFYPKKRKISLKHRILKLLIESPSISLNNRHLSIQKSRNPNISLEKNNINTDNNKNNIMQINNNDNSSQSIDIIKKQNCLNGKLKENNININNIKRYKKDKELSNEDNNNNKSKIAFLTLGNNNNKRKSIFKKSIIIKKKTTIMDDINKKENIKKIIKFNSFYYYCFSKLKNKKKEEVKIKLFNFAISFYKQKLDIIYLFHIILLFEKILERKKDNILNEEETFYQLNEY